MLYRFLFFNLRKRPLLDKILTFIVKLNLTQSKKIQDYIGLVTDANININSNTMIHHHI